MFWGEAPHSLVFDGKVGEDAKMVRQIAILMNVADNAEGFRGQISAQRDVIDGSPPLEAQTRGDNRQVWPQGGLERLAKADQR